ncbi:hypothetical protein [Candidatus Spongiihabitans sp.]|uniref:hypothetical protein n=1 Tax=Candidatus Spongiihabitans sp. TaxID=3101308 RepID=UPI003C6FEA4F
MGLCLLIGLASPAGAQTFPDSVGIGAVASAGYIDLYYRLGQEITPVVFPAATGGTGDLTYSLRGGARITGVCL